MGALFTGASLPEDEVQSGSSGALYVHGIQDYKTMLCPGSRPRGAAAAAALGLRPQHQAYSMCGCGLQLDHLGNEGGIQFQR